MVCDVDVSIFVRTLIKCVSCDRQGCSGCVFLAITEVTHDVRGSYGVHRVHASRDCLLLRFVGAITEWRLQIIKSLV